jgi:hypothetical protein
MIKSKTNTCLCINPYIYEFNTVLGEDSFLYNTTGSSNTVYGYAALQNNTIGTANVAIGSDV